MVIIPLIDLSPPHLCACPKSESRCPSALVVLEVSVDISLKIDRGAVLNVVICYIVNHSCIILYLQSITRLRRKIVLHPVLLKTSIFSCRKCMFPRNCTFENCMWFRNCFIKLLAKPQYRLTGSLKSS